MRENIKEFFLGLEEPNFLAMKLLFGVFKRFENGDKCSQKIVDNIGLFSKYNIRLLHSKDSCNSVFTTDDLSRIDFSIAESGTEEIVCHEFGHLLLDIFARGEVPDEYSEVNKLCRKRLLMNEEEVFELLELYRDITFAKITENLDEPLGFCNRHPEYRELYFIENPEAIEEDLINDILIEHFALVANIDQDIEQYSKVSNIIDSIFCGDNPFCFAYGNDEIDPILAMHCDEYFEDADFGPDVLGFEEQFADYLVFRTFPEKMNEAKAVLYNLLGQEWFTMMNRFYEKVTDRIGDDKKVYQYKNNDANV